MTHTPHDALFKLRYVVLALDAVRLGQLHDKLRMLSPATGALTMTTIAEQWLADARASGAPPMSSSSSGGFAAAPP